MENYEYEENLVVSTKIEGDEIENILRPRSMDGYIGQEKVKDNLCVFMQSAKMRGEALDHVLLYGPAGLGKTTLAHIIANPDPVLYRKLGLDPKGDYGRSAIGVLTISPAETAVICADIAMKSSGATVEFVDRFTGTLIITGTVSEAEAAIIAVTDYCRDKLHCTVCEVTRT